MSEEEPDLPQPEPDVEEVQPVEEPPMEKPELEDETDKPETPAADNEVTETPGEPAEVQLEETEAKPTKSDKKKKKKKGEESGDQAEPKKKGKKKKDKEPKPENSEGEHVEVEEKTDKPTDEVKTTESEMKTSAPETDLEEEEAKEKKGKKKKKGTPSEASLKGKKGKKKKKKGTASQVSIAEKEEDNKEKSTVSIDAKEEKKKKKSTISEVSVEGQEVKKKKKSTISEVSIEGKEIKKKKKSTISEISVEGQEVKKKKKSTISEVSIEGQEIKKKKKSTLSEVSVEGKEKKKKKKKASASETDVERKEKKKKKKSKTNIKEGKKQKGKTPKKSQSSLGTTASQKSLKKKKKSKDETPKTESLYDLQKSLSRLESKLSEMRSKSRVTVTKSSSIWTIETSDSDDSEEYEEEPIEIKQKSSVRIAKKTKKGKGKKGKDKKKEKSTSGETSEESEPPKKKPKGKGKKKKTPKEETDEPTDTEPQVDVLAEITRMKYLAELAASGGDTEEETTETAPKKKKKKKAKKGAKKKLSKKEKARLAAEAAEKARQNAEEEAAKAAELERIRLIEERKAAIEKEKRETFEQQIRMEQLEQLLEQYKDLVNYNKQMRAKAKDQAEWEVYVNCGRLPNPSKCDQMNTYLHLWDLVVDETTMEEAAKRTNDVLELLNELDDLIDTTDSKNNELVENWKWVRLLFRKQQAKSLDVATYRLLRNIEKNLHRIDIPTADYKYQDDNIALCLWLRIQLPTPLPNPRRPPKPRIEVAFPEMKLEVQFPVSLDGEKVAIRALYVNYDHLSDLCETYDKPLVPDEYDRDLCNAIRIEWREKLIYKYKNRVKPPPPPPQEGEENENQEQEEQEDIIGPDDVIPIVPYRKLEPTASEFVISLEDELYNSTRNSLIKPLSDDAINLRKYSIIGGVYCLNLLHQPPQPQDFVTLEMNLTPLYLPKELELVNINLEYNPPEPTEPGVRRLPEEIEEEMKKQEEELEKLILVTLTWPEHVIFLELPMVCYWNEEKMFWSKNDVYDLKHNEEKGELTFRTRKGAIFALAVYKYANLPYQAWEMKPEANGSISLQITAAILMVEFNVKDGLVALSQLQNSPNNALQDIIGLYFSLPKLIRMLQTAGVDVFPAFDAFCYIENTCEKHWPMEKHLYYNMAQLSICFNFAWSRWNLAAGRRSIILQMREYNLEKTKQKSHMMLKVTPLNAIYVDCTEVSQMFNEEGIENMKFYPDLYHLMKGTSSMALKNKIGKAPKELVYALYELLVATRVLSFS